MDFKQTEQTRRLVEVTALLALSLHGDQSVKVKKALEAYAFPKVLAEKINKVFKDTDLVSVRGICSVVNCLNTHHEVELVADIHGKVPICIECLESDK